MPFCTVGHAFYRFQQVASTGLDGDVADDVRLWSDGMTMGKGFSVVRSEGSPVVIVPADDGDDEHLSQTFGILLAEPAMQQLLSPLGVGEQAPLV